MATKIVRKPAPDATEKPAESAPKPRRTVILISKSLACNPGMDPDARHYFKNDLSSLNGAINGLKALSDTFPLTEESFAFAVETILDAAIEKLEHVYSSLEENLSMLEPAEKGGER